jgi:hypothetical protein
MKYGLSLIAALSLSACLGSSNGAEVSRAASGFSNCAYLGGMAGEYMQGTNVRCGPQAELPYTVK